MDATDDCDDFALPLLVSSAKLPLLLPFAAAPAAGAGDSSGLPALEKIIESPATALVSIAACAARLAAEDEADEAGAAAASTTRIEVAAAAADDEEDEDSAPSPPRRSNCAAENASSIGSAGMRPPRGAISASASLRGSFSHMANSTLLYFSDSNRST